MPNPAAPARLGVGQCECRPAGGWEGGASVPRRGTEHLTWCEFSCESVWLVAASINLSKSIVKKKCKWQTHRMSRHSTLPQSHRALQSRRKRGRMKRLESFLCCGCEVLKWLLITHGCHRGAGAVISAAGECRGGKKEKEKLGTGFPCDARFSIISFKCLLCFSPPASISFRRWLCHSLSLSHQALAIIIAFYLFGGQRLDGAVC